MFCKNCGKEITSTDKFCNSCGAVIEAPDNSTVEAPFNEIPVEQPVVEQSSPSVAPMGVTPEAPVAPAVETPVAPVAPAPAAPVEPAPTYSEPVSTPTPAAPVEPTIKPVEPTPVITDSVMGTTSAAPTKKGGNKGFIIIVIILGAIILGAGGFIGYKFFFEKKDTPTVEPGTPTEPDTPSTPTTPDTPDTPTNPTSTDDAKSFTLNGYKFTVPAGFTKTVEDGHTFFDAESAYFMALAVDNETTYDSYKASLDTVAQKIIPSWNKNGYTFLEFGEAAATNGSKLLYVQFYNQTNGVYGDVVISKLTDGSLLGSQLFYKTEDGAKIGYNGIADFTKSAVKDTNSTYSGKIGDSFSISNIDVSKIK